MADRLSIIAVGCLMIVGLVAAPIATVHGQNRSAEYRIEFAQAVRKAANYVLPAVVSIEVIGVAEAPAGNSRSEVSQDAPSCGIVVDESGLILASDIIVRRSSASLLVVLPDGNRLAAKVLSRDHHRGLVMLQVTPEKALQAIEFPDSIDTPIGSTIVAVGRYGADSSPMVSSGIFSAAGRLEGTMLQCDARVSPSYYGGPMVDLYGNFLGVLVPAVAPGGAPDETSWYDSGVAFAVPSDVIKAKLPRLREGKDIQKGLIGIVPKNKDPYAEDTELAAVRNRSPAEKAGLRPGDQIQSIGGQRVKMFQEIKQALGPHDAGETISIVYARDNQEFEVSIELTESIPPLNPQRLGIWATESSSEDQGSLDVVVQGVVPSTPAEGKLAVGDVITKVGMTEITNLETLKRLLITAVADESFTLLVDRDGESLPIEIMPSSIAGPALSETVDSWNDPEASPAWEVQELRLPDAANTAAYVAPAPDNVDSDAGLALLMVLLSPDKRDPKEALESWREAAQKQGVVVCVICSEEEKRWQQKEIDVVSRMATLMAQRVPTQVSAVASEGAVKGIGASAADAMTIAIALSDRKHFAGISVSEDTKPPAIRLRENEPDSALQILMPVKDISDGPTWLATLTRAGYPITYGGVNDLPDLLRWVRLLQTI